MKIRQGSRSSPANGLHFRRKLASGLHSLSPDAVGLCCKSDIGALRLDTYVFQANFNHTLDGDFNSSRFLSRQLCRLDKFLLAHSIVYYEETVPKCYGQLGVRIKNAKRSVRRKLYRDLWLPVYLYFDFITP